MTLATTFCPATMCPLFAIDGSPWTGDQNAACPKSHDACAWYVDGKKAHCSGCDTAKAQAIIGSTGRIPLQIGAVQVAKVRVTAKKFDCPRAADCQWQAQSGKRLCPPRYALSIGIDPRICAY